MSESRYEKELEVIEDNIIYLYKKELEEALHNKEFIKAQFIRMELNAYLSTEI